MLADGAYQISSLQSDQRDLLREEQALDEQLELLGSTQNLTANAEALGMVASGNPVFLDVATGGVSGSGLDVRRRCRAEPGPRTRCSTARRSSTRPRWQPRRAAEAASGDTGQHVDRGRHARGHDHDRPDPDRHPAVARDALRPR